MIIENILDKFFNFILSLTEFTDSIVALNISVDNSNIQTAINVIKGASFFLPIAGLVPLFTIAFLLLGFRITISIFKFVKGCIPTMGG